MSYDVTWSEARSELQDLRRYQFYGSEGWGIGNLEAEAGRAGG